MTLRVKTLTIIGLTLLGMIVSLYVASGTILLTSFDKLEENQVYHETKKAVNVLTNDLTAMDNILRGWSIWDDTYTFVMDGNEKYIQTNLTDFTFVSNNLNLMVFIDLQGKIVYEQGFDLKNKKSMPISPVLQSYLVMGSPLLYNTGKTEPSVRGMIMLPEGPMLVVAQPILNSEGNAPICGTTIIGRYLDEAEINSLSETTYSSLKIVGLHDTELTPDFLAVRSVLSETTKMTTRVIDEQTIAGYAVLNDINDKPILLLRTDVPREIYQQGKASTRYFVMVFAIAGVLLGGATMFLTEKIVLSRLASLSATVKSIGDHGDVTARIAVRGNDELSSLAQAVNSMLSGLEQSQYQLQEQQIALLQAHDELELRVRERTAQLAATNAMLERDIMARKEMEQQLHYLSQHDTLTGLYNRTYFETEFGRLEQQKEINVGIIVCDVDGLKLVNDTLGHQSGDLLLITAAKAIQESAGAEFYIARIGGDEFAIIMCDVSSKTVEEVCHAISDTVTRYNEEKAGIPLSLSVGFAVSGDRERVSLRELFKQADNNMYREKMHRSQSARSAIVEALMKALEVRDFITEGHATRLQDIVANLAIAVGLPEQSIADLRLLAKFHDIGKVGIPDSVLFKPEHLNASEKAVMQSHCEIGCRIANAARDLAHISDWILKHHEWWNGKGYPLGMRGEDIPIGCRILAIADAYDAMTNDRPYRKALSHEQAIAEVRRCAGSQFDPILVERFMEVYG